MLTLPEHDMTLIRLTVTFLLACCTNIIIECVCFYLVLLYIITNYIHYYNSCIMSSFPLNEHCMVWYGIATER